MKYIRTITPPATVANVVAIAAPFTPHSQWKNEDIVKSDIKDSSHNTAHHGVFGRTVKTYQHHTGTFKEEKYGAVKKPE